MNKEFELRKIAKEIKRNGSLYSFNRMELNKYKEPTDVVKSVIELKGLYHETRSYINISTTEGANIISKPQPLIMCVYEAAKDLEQGDIVVIGNNTYTVNAINNLQNYNIIIDISLELRV